ncbi:MAG: class I SAM-dependent methyltransferase [Pseudomonadota bacterium]
MQTETLDMPQPQENADEAFLERAGDIINSGAQAVMISIGHRTGLFDKMAERPRWTSAELADAAGLAERYVREWLAAMVTAEIVSYQPDRKNYHLPDAHAACLTREGRLGNIAVYAQMIPLMGAVQDPILRCFETGEGLNYDDYPCFHQFMEEDSTQTVVGPLFEILLPLVAGLETRLRAGIDVLDAGCGRGKALVAMAARFPGSQFTGYDLGANAIDDAKRAAREAGLRNIQFEVRDLTGFDERERYDFVTSFDAVHDQKDPQGLLMALHRALRPGGFYLMQDVGGSANLEKNMDFPMASLLYAISCTHCTPVSIGQGGAGLGTMWGWETAEAMLRMAGFDAITRHVLPHDPMNVWFVSEKASARRSDT